MTDDEYKAHQEKWIKMGQLGQWLSATYPQTFLEYQRASSNNVVQTELRAWLSKNHANLLTEYADYLTLWGFADA